jgi:hypothetical protein
MGHYRLGEASWGDNRYGGVDYLGLWGAAGDRGGFLTCAQDSARIVRLDIHR